MGEKDRISEGKRRMEERTSVEASDLVTQSLYIRDLSENKIATKGYANPALLCVLQREYAPVRFQSSKNTKLCNHEMHMIKDARS